MKSPGESSRSIFQCSKKPWAAHLTDMTTPLRSGDLRGKAHLEPPLTPRPSERFPNIVFRSTVGRNTTTLFMMRLCDLADEITRSRGIDSAEAEFFSILLEIVQG